MCANQEQEQEQEIREKKLRKYSCRRCGHVYDSLSALQSHTFISHKLADKERLELARLGLIGGTHPGKGVGSSSHQRYHRQRVLERRMEARLNGITADAVRKKKKQQQKNKK